MELIKYLFDLFIHLDVHLNDIITQYGTLTYIILFVVIFCETGLVLTPFLPGDSLIFAAATFAARGSLNIHFLFLTLAAASILGDTSNYWIGHFIGPKIFQKENVRFLKKEYLDRTHDFYERYGGKTVIFARFIPIIRTFSPFVAGIGSMTYSKFVLFIILGAVAWVGIFAYGGYFFGNIDFIKHNFSVVIIAIICISLLPGLIGYLKHKNK